MLRLFADYAAGVPGAVGTEVEVEQRLGDAVVHGRVDRLEHVDGGVRVVDLKTGREVSLAEGATNPQLAVYQLALNERAHRGGDPVGGAVGARLVYLRPERRSAGLRPQDSLPDGGGWARETLEAAVDVMRGGSFEAVVNATCQFCPVRTSCPVSDEGERCAQVIAVSPSHVTAVEIARVVGDVVPTPEQRAAIEAPLAPVLVVAGAGAGKTATMAARVVYLVVNGLARPEEILALTFTRKAAGEISDRVRAKLAVARRHFPIPDDGVQPAMSTYNAFAAGLVRDHALRLGRDPDATLVTRAGAWQIMDGIVQAWPEEVEADLTPGTVVDRALTLGDALRTNLLSVDEAREGLTRLIGDFEQGRDRAPSAALRAPADKLRARLALLELVRAHEERKRGLSVVEFSDQVALACEIARRVPAVGALLRAQFKVVLLDEFQDTSVAQLDLLADLFGRGHAVMAVGDPNQAIYGWRGASAASLTGFRARFGSQSVTTLSLTTSWRNDRAILAAANALSGPLRAANGEGGELLGPLAPRPGAGDGAVDVSAALTSSGEADAIARWVEERWAPGTGSAAVLCRARKQFMPVMRALRDRGLPASVVGLGGLLQVPEVLDLRSALQVANDASRGDALMRLLTNARLGVADLRVLTDWSCVLSGVGGDGGSATIVEALDELPPPGWANPDGHELSEAGRARLERLRRTLRRVRDVLLLPLPDLVAAAEQELGLDIEVAARAGADPGAARANLDSFATHAATYAAGVLAPTLSGFLAWLDAAEANENGLDIEPVDVTTNAVQVLTVHAAKGLSGTWWWSRA